MPQVARRPLAETDILEIWDYIADDSLTALIAGWITSTNSSG